MLFFHGIIMAPADIQLDQFRYADSFVVVRFPLACDQVTNPDSPIVAWLELLTKSFGNFNYTKTKSPISRHHQTSKLQETRASGTVHEGAGCHQYGKPVSEDRELGSLWSNNWVFAGSSISIQVQHNPVIRYNSGLPVFTPWTTWTI
jgi:hypothetical protein